MIELIVHGEPAPQGSKRSVGRGILIESSKKVQPWREAIVSEALRKGLNDLALDGPLQIAVSFYFKRPASHYGKRDGIAYVKDSAPEYKFGTPDGDKLLRSTFDGLVQAGVVVDDARFVIGGYVKLFSTNGFQGAIIRITEMNKEQKSCTGMLNTGNGLSSWSQDSLPSSTG
jgi:Holliday junction resolvase RusA-like endonuclease